MRQEACQNATRHVRNYVRISLRSGQGQKSHKLFQVFQGRSCRWWVGSKTRLRAGAKFIRIVATPNEMDLCCPISRQRPPGGWGNREIFRPTAIGSGTDMRPTAMAMIRPRDADARPTALQPDSPAGNRLRLPSSRHRRSLPTSSRRDRRAASRASSPYVRCADKPPDLAPVRRHASAHAMRTRSPFVLDAPN